MPNFASSVHDLGDYLREQRQSAQLSLRQLSAVAGISNPYLSQIERGLKKPSAEILQALAKALRISAESLYVRAGFLEESTDRGDDGSIDVTAAILAEPRLTDRQRGVLLDVYESFVGEPQPRTARTAPTAPKAPSAPSASRSSRSSEPRPVPSPHSSSPVQQTTSSTTKQSNTKEKKS